jgi:5-methylcytosine-specific restriction enzyme subunit McrC
LWEAYSDWVDVQFPSPATEGGWELFSNGAVGYLPFVDGSFLTIRPRVPILSIFRMWEVAEGIKLDRPPGDVAVQTLEDLLDWLAVELCNGVLRRLGQGLYRAYVNEADELAALRGRVDLRAALRRPWRVALPCEFQELTTDVVDNQILLAGLQASSYMARKPATLALVRRSWWLCLRSGVTPRDVSPSDCMGRTYNRLNSDYERLHWLCHFILSGTAPTHAAGSAKLQAFIIQMPKLFERFVAAWLKRNLPMPMNCHHQVHLALDQHLEFIADLVISGGDEEPLAVLDTKYKIDAEPKLADIAQVVAYAQRLDCTEAILVYPTRDHQSINIAVGDIHVRSVAYPLDGDLDLGGQMLIDQLQLA